MRSIDPQIKKQNIYKCYRRNYLNNDEYRERCRISNRKAIKASRHYEHDLKKNNPMLHIYYCSSYLFNPKSKINLETKKHIEWFNNNS